MPQRKSPRTAGVPRKVGFRAPAAGFDGFQQADIQETNALLANYLGDAPRKKRQKPLFAANGKTPNLTTHVLTKLKAAAKGGKGVCALSKAELSVVMARIKPRRKRRRSSPKGSMPE